MSKNDEFITLGQLLKVEGYVQSGGEAKMRMDEFEIKVNGQKENRRGRKLYPGDEVHIDGNQHMIEHEN